MTEDDHQKLFWLNLKGFTIHRPSTFDDSKFLWKHYGELYRYNFDGVLVIYSISDMYFYEVVSD